jgi:hypothetical protein
MPPQGAPGYADPADGRIEEDPGVSGLAALQDHEMARPLPPNPSQGP